MKRLSEFDSLILDLTPYQWDSSNVMEVPFSCEYIQELLESKILFIKISGSTLELPIMYFPAKYTITPSSQTITGYSAVYGYSELIYNNDGVTYLLTFFNKAGANAKFLIEEI